MNMVRNSNVIFQIRKENFISFAEDVVMLPSITVTLSCDSVITTHVYT